MQETPSLIPGLGRSAAEGTGYPLQYSWASLVAQLVRNLPAVQEAWVASSIPAWRVGLQESEATERLSLSLFLFPFIYFYSLEANYFTIL